MTQASPKNLLKVAQICSTLLNFAQKSQQICSNFLKTAQNCSKCDQDVSKCLTMGQQVSKGVIFLPKLSLLGIGLNVSVN
jgi:hypothetical protein